jgi:hypothetical protein
VWRIVCAFANLVSAGEFRRLVWQDTPCCGASSLEEFDKVEGSPNAASFAEISAAASSAAADSAAAVSAASVSAAAVPSGAESAWAAAAAFFSSAAAAASYV